MKLKKNWEKKNGKDLEIKELEIGIDSKTKQAKKEICMKSKQEVINLKKLMKIIKSLFIKKNLLYRYFFIFFIINYIYYYLLITLNKKKNRNIYKITTLKTKNYSIFNIFLNITKYKTY